MTVDFSLNKINLYACTGRIENADEGEHCWFEFTEVSDSVGKDWRVTLHTNARVICEMVAALPEHIPGLKETVFALAEKWAPEPDLAECVCRGISQQAELLRREILAAKIDEGRIILHRMSALGKANLDDRARIVAARISELEAEGEEA